MKIDFWCKKCGASFEMTKYRANDRTTYALVHSLDYPFEKDCKFSKIVIGLKFEEDD